MRWLWTDEPGLAPTTRAFLSGFEVEEAFETCLELVSTTGDRARGLRLHPEDAEWLKARRYVLSGDSLGLALLTGRLGALAGRGWPRRCLAWGCVRPTRDESFAVFPVGGVKEKIALARILGPLRIVHPASEEDAMPPGCVEIGIPRSIEAAIRDLAVLVQEG